MTGPPRKFPFLVSLSFLIFIMLGNGRGWTSHVASKAIPPMGFCDGISFFDACGGSMKQLQMKLMRFAILDSSCWTVMLLWFMWFIMMTCEFIQWSSWSLLLTFLALPFWTRITSAFPLYIVTTIPKWPWDWSWLYIIGSNIRSYRTDNAIQRLIPTGKTRSQ